MAQTTTQEKTIEGEIVGEASAAQPLAVVSDEQRNGKFSDVLQERIDDIAPLLPAHIKRDKFIAAANAMVRQNPELLECTQRSLFNALAQSAQDGLLPDAREGVILPYKEQTSSGTWVKVAKWNPMAYGMRKRAKELDSIIVDTQVVHDKDNFIWHQGDDPRLEHQPPKLGTDRGPMIGVYAIFKRDGVILHREVMSRQQVMDVKSKSKAQTSLMWTTFETEAWRKTVLRRGMKTIPVSEDLERIFTRDDENFEFNNHAPSAPALVPPPAPSIGTPPSPPAAPTPEIVTIPESAKTISMTVTREGGAGGGGHNSGQVTLVHGEREAKAEYSPYLLPMVTENNKPVYVKWGMELIGYINAAPTVEQIHAIEDTNKATLDTCKLAAPRAYGSIQKAIAKRIGEIGLPTGKASDDLADWLDQLQSCTSPKAVDDLCDLGLQNIFPGDHPVWRERCAAKAAELF